MTGALYDIRFRWSICDVYDVVLTSKIFCIWSMWIHVSLRTCSFYHKLYESYVEMYHIKCLFKRKYQYFMSLSKSSQHYRNLSGQFHIILWFLEVSVSSWNWISKNKELKIRYVLIEANHKKKAIRWKFNNDTRICKCLRLISYIIFVTIRFL